VTGAARWAPGVYDESDIDYQMYGLVDGNPYVHRELDAWNEADRNLLVPLAGLPSIEDIDRHIRRPEAADGSIGFLLSGEGATGRTSLARLIMHRYAEVTGVRENFHVVGYNKVHHDSGDRVHGILKAVRNHVMRKNPGRHHRETLMQQMPHGEAGAALTELDLQAQADYLADYMKTEIKPRMHLGLLIEGMQDDDFMDVLSRVFEYVETVIVVTHDNYRTSDTASVARLDEREQWQKWAMRVNLPNLSGDGAKELTLNRWRNAAPQVDCPFELDGVKDTFDNRQSPVGLTLSWLRYFLFCRLLDHDGSVPWPEDQNLRLSQAWMQNKLRQVDSAPVDRRWGNGHG
jgi:hypothetical protein